MRLRWACLDKNGDFMWPEEYISDSIGVYNMSKEEFDSAMQEASGKIYYKGIEPYKAKHNRVLRALDLATLAETSPQ